MAPSGAYRHAHSQGLDTLDFVCGIGLYLMPGDMARRWGNVQGYNNEIQVCGSDAVIGHNPGINAVEPINPVSKGDKAFQGHHQPRPFTRAHSPRALPARMRRMTTARLLHLRLTLQVFRRNGRAMGRRRLTKKKNGLSGHWDSIWPSGALVIVSLASPEQPREARFPQQWPRPTKD